MQDHWTQIRGNVYLTKPTPGMLLDGEEIPIRNARLKGGSTQDKRTRMVLFDRAYVVAYIEKSLLIPLNIQKHQHLDLLKGLLDEAFDHIRESEIEEG